jgi:regulator of sirC expression with transglutaminase-like and TPR domain
VNTRKQFLQLIESDQTDLATGALLIARHFQPSMNVETELFRIAQLSDQASSASVTDAESLVQFFADLGFHGNANEYYDVNNSLLNQVIQRKTGIPITLGVVYLAVIRRLPQPTFTAAGVNFPGHFLITVDDGHRKQLIDVFDVRLTTERECYARLHDSRAQPDPQHFRQATDKDILCRILENLKVIYWQADQLQTVIDCLDYQLMIFPDNAKLLGQQQKLLRNSQAVNSQPQHLH